MLHCAGVNEKVDIVLCGTFRGGNVWAILSCLLLGVVRGAARTGFERRMEGRCLFLLVGYS